MARIITVNDDELNLTASIEMAGTAHAVRRVIVESGSESGLPDGLLNALIPFVGLPGIRPVAASPVRAVPDAVPDPGEPQRPGNRAAPVAAFISPAVTKRAATLTAVPSPRPPVELEAAPPPKEDKPKPAKKTAKATPAKRGPTQYRRPSDADLEAAIKQVGAKPTDLGKFFGVPNQTVNNWLYIWRKRKASNPNPGI